MSSIFMLLVSQGFFPQAAPAPPVCTTETQKTQPISEYSEDFNIFKHSPIKCIGIAFTTHYFGNCGQVETLSCFFQNQETLAAHSRQPVKELTLECSQMRFHLLYYALQTYKPYLKNTSERRIYRRKEKSEYTGNQIRMHIT